MSTTLDGLIVGAGFSGIALAYELKKETARSSSPTLRLASVVHSSQIAIQELDATLQPSTTLLITHQTSMQLGSGQKTLLPNLISSSNSNDTACFNRLNLISD